MIAESLDLQIEGVEVEEGPKALLPFIQQARSPEPVEIDKENAIVVSDEGKYEIASYLEYHSELRDSHALSNKDIRHTIDTTCGWEERVPSGNGHRYQGKFAKRLGKAYADLGVKLSKETLARVGEIASRYSVNKNFWIDFTNCFDWSDGDYGDNGSCYWGDREEARFILMAHGVWAVRFYRHTARDPANVTDVEGYGRAWVVVDKTYPGDLLIFNLYGPTKEEFRVTLEHWLEKATGETYRGNTRSVGICAYEPLYMNHDALLFTTRQYVNTSSSIDLDSLIEYDQDFKYKWYNLVPGFCPSRYDDDQEEDEEEGETVY